MSDILARCNGTEIVDRNDEIWIVQKRSPPHVLSWIFGLVAFIAIVNALVQGFMGATQRSSEPAVAAGILLVLGVVCVGILVALRRAGARWAEEPVAPSLIIAGGTLLDDHRRPLAALADVRYELIWQLFSSSRALALVWPSGDAIIARGNPFGDSVAGCKNALRSRGITAA